MGIDDDILVTLRFSFNNSLFQFVLEEQIFLSGVRYLSNEGLLKHLMSVRVVRKTDWTFFSDISKFP